MKKYKVGYIAGVFDLFHVGHLNLIERAKAECDQLIVGVLTDDLVVKNKGKAPYIPFKERLRIVGSVKAVDRAVGVDDSNIQKMDAWKRYHFDCLFSGNDYAGNKYWIEDKAALNAVGSNIEFFPYTKSTSSTQIKKALHLEDHDADEPAAKPMPLLGIWAHRGCSYRYPENTLTAFSHAAELFGRGLTGIETDIQLTSDGHMVVIHDESVERTTDGKGCVRDYSLEEIKRLNIDTGGPSHPEHIPTIEEVLDLLEEPLHQGMLLNIELKNSFFSYEGMEEKILQLVDERGLSESIVYSSFSIKSIAWIRALGPKAHTAILGGAVSDLYWKINPCCKAGALHPAVGGMDVEPKLLRENGLPVRAWMSAPLYPDKSEAPVVDQQRLSELGVTDIFVNDPERYCSNA